MIRLVNEPMNCKAVRMIFVCLMVLSMLVLTDTVLAKGGGDEEHRSEFYGIVQKRPDKGTQGTWVIGNRAFTADAGTEIDESEGRLSVGSCAKVHLRNNRIHEIDSEPMRHCQ